MHVLGFGGHAGCITETCELFLDSEEERIQWLESHRQRENEGILAVLTRLKPGISPNELTVEDLGNWNDEAFHIQGDVGVVQFGVSTRNGLQQPWAEGTTPDTELSGNKTLNGSVSWSGALTGMTPSEEVVIGNSGLNVNLSNLQGKTRFH